MPSFRSTLSSTPERTDEIKRYDKHRRAHFVFIATCIAAVAVPAVFVYGKWADTWGNHSQATASSIYRWGVAAGAFPVYMASIVVFAYYVMKGWRKS
jgi:hypothetical protein